jgi:UDP-galactopyranose mutase
MEAKKSSFHRKGGAEAWRRTNTHDEDPQHGKTSLLASLGYKSLDAESVHVLVDKEASRKSRLSARRHLFESWNAVPALWRKSSDVVVVGAGLSGAVLAEQLASRLSLRVLIIEKREHIAGNCYDFEVDNSGVLMSRYGAHLFHTDDERVWSYVNRFATWNRWEHEVLANVDGSLVPVPVNPTTVNVLAGETLRSEAEMRAWLEKQRSSAGLSELSHRAPANSEEMAISRVGRTLYEKLFRPYTLKQWEREPSELAPSVLARIPVHTSFDTRYFPDRYQALPANGYTDFIDSMLDHPLIAVALNTDYFDVRSDIRGDRHHDTKNAHIAGHERPPPATVVFTGPIDAYFADRGLEKLEYRSLRFESFLLRNAPYFQPVSVVNYPSTDFNFTRIVEHKHFLSQKSPHTVITIEFPSPRGEPYYPVPSKRNLDLYARYQELAASQQDSVHFVGRLASYKYYNMDAAIANALQYFDANLSALSRSV